MLRRIAAIGGDDAWRQSLVNASEGKHAQIIPVSSKNELPAGTVSVVAAGDEAGPVVDAALWLGNWQEQALDLLAEAIDCREGFVEGASRRVRDHARRFAEALGLAPADQSTLERGACVRDIGKTKIPNEILLKQGVLSYDEWLLLQRHPEIGAAIIQGVDGLKDTADIVRYHHECFDGDGYPAGLEGDKIPFLARVMKIVDVYCAMTSPRHYREGHSTHGAAIEYLRSERGKHYDPGLVDTFIAGNVGQPQVQSLPAE